MHTELLRRPPAPTRTMAVILTLLGLSLTEALAAPSEAWLRYHGFASWESVLDHDGDGVPSGTEFEFGTDPLDPASHPPNFRRIAGNTSFQIEIVAGIAYGSAQLQTSTNMISWGPVDGFPVSAPGVFHIPVDPDEPERFFRFDLPSHRNSDGDCLLDYEELNLYGTDPLKTDTDGDGLDDCAEILVYRTDPNHASLTGRGDIRGKIVLDADRDPATRDHTGIAGWTVFTDLDFDGEWDSNEPSATSAEDGTYRIAELDPGVYRVGLVPKPAWIQVFPTWVPMPSPDGFPDRVVEVFDSGKGPIAFPYGRYPDPLPGLRILVPSPPPGPVEASVVVGPLPAKPISGPFGGWAHVDVVSFPTDAHLVVAFDGEELFDGPGADLAIWCAAASPEDAAEIWVGSTPSNLVRVGLFPQQETMRIDFASVRLPGPVRFLKIRGQGLGGTYPGIDVVGFEALNYRPISRAHYDVTVLGGQSSAGVDFGVAGNDRPPRISIGLDRWDVRAGETVGVEVLASDDLAVTGSTLRANGRSVALDAAGKATVSVTSGGLLTLLATATDSANQNSDTSTVLIARNADGTLPNLSGLSVPGGAGPTGPSVQIVSPVAGEILTNAHAIVGTIAGSGSAVATWTLDYAPADAVNPEALDVADPDYVRIGQGTGPATQEALGMLPADTLPPGAYLLRIAASDINGTTRYSGFVVGVRVDPLDIRPLVLLRTPTNHMNVSYVNDIVGSVITRKQLREWRVEFAPLKDVNLRNLGNPSVSWTRIASGTNVVMGRILGQFDPSLLRNDAYVLRLSAWNRNGLGWSDAVVVDVTGKAKYGEFAVEFTDVELPLAGIPIQLKRRYSSLEASRSGDFGHGWTMAVADADISETIPQTGSGLGATPFRVGGRVYLTAPDGERIGFTFDPKVGAASFLGAAYRAVFKPDPGVRYRLVVPERDTPFLTVLPNGDVALFFLSVPWNPDTYILIAADGTEYTYDQRDGLLEIRDPNGNRVTFTPDAIAHSAGPRLKLSRDAAGRIQRVEAPDGQVWQYQYDTQGDLVRVLYPGGIQANLGYSATRPHFLESIQDPWRGPNERTEYDAAGRVVAIIDAAGNRRGQAWDLVRFSGTFTDARGNRTLINYNPRGNVIRVTSPTGGVTQWEYKDPLNPDRPTAIIDPRNQRITFKYDARGNLVEQITPIGRNGYTYDSANHLLAHQHGTFGTESFEYDANGNLAHYSEFNHRVGFTRTANGQLSTVRDGKDGISRLEYDGGRKIPSRIFLPDGSVKQFEFDAADRVVRYIDPLGQATRFEYDSAGRLVREINAGGGEQVTTYDTTFPDRPASTTDRAGRVSRYEYDAMGRVRQMTAPGGAVTRYEYDADGNRTGLVDPMGNRYGFAWDASNRLIEETDPRGNKRQHRYDAAGNRVETIDRNGRKRTFAYNALGHLTAENWLDPVTGATNRTIRYSYDRATQLVGVEDPDAKLSFDQGVTRGGPLFGETASYTGAPVRHIAFAYDAAMRRSRVSMMTTSPSLESAMQMDYIRDASGRVGIIQGRNPLPPSTQTGMEFDLVVRRNTRGDVTELRRYADAGRTKEVSRSLLSYSDPCHCHLERIEHIVATNQPLPSATLDFVRDPDGGVLSLTSGNDTLTYTYDPAGQITGVTRNGEITESYVYDPNGNRTDSRRYRNPVTEAPNRVVESGFWSLTYDNEGNLLTKSNTFTHASLQLNWDHRNRLTRVDVLADGVPIESLAVAFRYDGLDRRIAVIAQGKTLWSYFDGTQEIAEFQDKEVPPSAVYFTGERLDEVYAVWRRGEGLFWLLNDHLGSPRRILDANGVEVAALEYDAFGNPVLGEGPKSSIGDRISFTGRPRDLTSGLLHVRARYYDPDLGRFISEDPLGFDGGDPNLYRYAYNRPMMLTDPTGMLSATEYAMLAMATTRPGKFCRLAICVAGMWSGVANSVINLVPAGNPNATCGAKLLGVPINGPSAGGALAGSLFGAGSQAYSVYTTGSGKPPNPILGTLIDLAVCAKEASN
jgi:RHS repeat-associated protein